jgi:hypothetical protein
MNDLVNVLSKAEIYVSHAKIRLQLDEYWHVIGNGVNDNIALLTNLCTGALQAATVIVNQPAMSALRVHSKFDYQGNVCRVV